MNNCIFCEIKDKGYCESEMYKSLYMDDDFSIVVGKGAIVPGYLMIVPNSHVLSTANLPQGKQKKLFALLNKTKDILQDTFNKSVVYYESGTGDDGIKFSNSIVHAHVHSAPIALSEKNDYGMKSQMFLEPFDYKKRLPELAHRGYSLYINPQGYGFAATTLDRPRQIFRKILAKQIGKPEAWNWRNPENEIIANIEITIDII